MNASSSAVIGLREIRGLSSKLCRSLSIPPCGRTSHWAPTLTVPTKKSLLSFLARRQFSTCSSPLLKENFAVCNGTVAAVNEKGELLNKFPQPLATLNSLEQIIKAKLELKKVVTYNSQVTSNGYKGIVCIQWPEEKIFCTQGRRKKTAIAEASFQALTWLFQNGHIDTNGRPLLPIEEYSSFYSKKKPPIGHQSTIMNDEKEKLLKYFPEPVQSLNNLEQIIKARLKINKVVNYSFKVTSEGYKCSLSIQWPQEEIFSAHGCRKRIALSEVSFQALSWLFQNNHINSKGRPLFSTEDKNTHTVFLSDDKLAKIDDVLKFYSEEVVPTLENSTIETNECMPENDTDFTHPTLCIPMPNEADLEILSQRLQAKHSSLPVSDLPVENYREKIVNTIKNNRVTIIKGETGCGKSTKIPQFILDESIRDGRGAFCNIAVSQPRRITALELARRMAEERNEIVGDSIGYSVKLDAKVPQTLGGSIMFLTAGKLCLIFISNPSLTGVSHVVLDEAHLRDTPTDMLMTLLKNSLQLNENLKIIIMSATINIELFKSFYESVGSVSTVEIPGRTFPVKAHYLDNLPKSLVSKQTRLPFEPVMDIPLATEVVKWLHNTKPDGGILVFVSGWMDMVEMKDLLSDCQALSVILVHSMLRDTAAAFAPAPPNIRKVILATNVAETSLTFPDVVYVVDCGVQKSQKRDLQQSGGWSSSRRFLGWISKANVLQRRGRAGRVQPGESFHLFSLKEYNNMVDFESPRIFSDHLERVILNMKMVFPEKSALDLLSLFPSPPNSKVVVKAVEFLKNANLLNVETELPTLLAKIVVQMSASLPSAIAIVYGAVFRCLDFVTSVVVCMESQGNIFADVRDKSKTYKQMFHKSSDHIANGRAIINPLDEFYNSINFTNALYLHKRLLDQILSIIHGKKKYIASDINVNEYTDEELVKCVLLHSPSSLLVVKFTEDLKANLYNENGMFAALRSGSVNYGVSSNSQFFLYLSGHSVNKVYLVDEVTAVSALEVLLFFRRNFSVIKSGDNLVIKAWNAPVGIVMPSQQFTQIESLQEAIQTMVNYFISTEMSGKLGAQDALMNSFRRKLLECIMYILNEKDPECFAVKDAES